jgi:hypothetical protein
MMDRNSFGLAEAISQEIAQPYLLTNETSFSPSVSATKDRAAPAAASFATLADSVFKVKCRLQQRYEQVFPALGDIICYVIDEEEANARKLSSDFPHVVLLALVERHMSQLGLRLRPDGPKNELRPPAFVPIAANRTSAVEQFV